MFPLKKQFKLERIVMFLCAKTLKQSIDNSSSPFCPILLCTLFCSPGKESKNEQYRWIEIEVVILIHNWRVVYLIYFLLVVNKLDDFKRPETGWIHVSNESNLCYYFP